MKNTKSIACITSLVILGIATTAISSALQKREAGPPSRVLQKQNQMASSKFLGAERNTFQVQQ
jgi:hypothetical protein